MFEVATQYNAIFRAQTGSPEGSTSLLSMWTSRRVHSFLGMLAGNLKRMEDSAVLRDALEASVFFATSMGRLGADFTAQLPALFETRMLAIVKQAWKDAPQQLEETLKVCRDAGIAAPLVSHNVEMEASAPTATSAVTSGGQPMPPPRTLMALPCLARVVNAILSGLNELRRCLLPGIFMQLRASLEEVITDVRRVLSINEKAVNAPTLRGEKRELREAASRMRIMFKDIVEPFLRGSLEMALGNFQAAEVQYNILRKLEEDERKAIEAAVAAKEQACLEAQDPADLIEEETSPESGATDGNNDGVPPTETVAGMVPSPPAQAAAAAVPPPPPRATDGPIEDGFGDDDDAFDNFDD